MPWYINLDQTVAIEDDEAETEEEAIELARQKMLGWLQHADKPYIELVWTVERE